mgnify:FL=1
MIDENKELAVLDKRFGKMIEDLVRDKISEFEDAEDVILESKLGLFLSMKRENFNRIPPKAYVKSLVAHKINDCFRRRYKDKEIISTMSERLISGIPNLVDRVDVDIFKNILSHRQYSILKLIGEGYSNSEIASILFISVNTVRTHIKEIYRIFGVNNRVKLAIYLNKVFNLIKGDEDVR